MHPSLLKRFPLLGFCLLVCSVPNFRPDTGGRRWTLIQGASSLALREGRALLSPLRCSGSRLLYMECALRCARSSPRVFHKRADSAAPAFCAFPARAAQAARSLTGALPRVRRAFCPPRSQPHFLPVPVGCTRLLPSAFPSPNPHLRRSGACILCLAATLPADVDHPESQEVFD